MVIRRVAPRKAGKEVVGAMTGPIVRWGAAVGLGAVWWWAVLRLLLPGETGVLEGTIAAGGWGLSVLPVHCAHKERPERRRGRSTGRKPERTPGETAGRTPGEMPDDAAASCRPDRRSGGAAAG